MKVPNPESSDINKNLFDPLSYFLVYNSYSNQEVIDLIHKKGIPRERILSTVFNKNGFILEAIVKTQIEKFMETSQALFPIDVQKLNGRANNLYYEQDRSGNIIVYSGYRKKTTYTEIDALYEYHQNGLIIPVIFEIKHSRGRNNSKIKRAVVFSLYKSLEVYFCKIRPKRQDEIAGLYDKSSVWHRKILIQGPEHIDIIRERVFV